MTEQPTPSNKPRAGWWPKALDPILDPNSDGTIGPISTGAGIFMGICVASVVAASTTLVIMDKATLGEQWSYVLQMVQLLASLGVVVGVPIGLRGGKKTP